MGGNNMVKIIEEPGLLTLSDEDMHLSYSHPYTK